MKYEGFLIACFYCGSMDLLKDGHKPDCNLEVRIFVEKVNQKVKEGG